MLASIKSKIWNVFCLAIFLHFRMVCSVTYGMLNTYWCALGNILRQIKPLLIPWQIPLSIFCLSLQLITLKFGMKNRMALFQPIQILFDERINVSAGIHKKFFFLRIDHFKIDMQKFPFCVIQDK